jgi:predicted phosphoadenosine phosphosulfate sulfurtransferase
VYQDADLSKLKPIYVDITELQRLTGTVYTLQKRVDLRLQGASFLSFDSETPEALRICYESVRTWIASDVVTPPAYVMEANRLGSMLFDADPDSSVRFVTCAPFGPLCIQAMSLERVRFKEAQENLLAEVQGRWSGAIYMRTFKTPNDKPYLFLGRHRVLVESSSRLAQHLHELVASGRRMRLAETIAHLQEDEEGYTPEAISDLLLN